MTANRRIAFNIPLLLAFCWAMTPDAAEKKDSIAELSEAALRDPQEIKMNSLTYLAMNWKIGYFITNPSEKMGFASKLKDPSNARLLIDEVELMDGDTGLMDFISPMSRMRGRESFVKTSRKHDTW